MSVIVTNIYAKKDSHSRAPVWCMRVVLKFYPLPLHPSNPNNFNQSVDSTASNGNNQLDEDSNALPSYPPSDLIIQKLSSPPTFHMLHHRSQEHFLHNRDFCHQGYQPEKAPWSTPQFGVKTENVVTRYVRSEGRFRGDRVNPLDTSNTPLRMQYNSNIPGMQHFNQDIPPETGYPPRIIEGVHENDKPQNASKTDAEDEDEEWMEAEWKVLAKFLDRIFFWIFLAMSTIVHTILFRQMVPE